MLDAVRRLFQSPHRMAESPVDWMKQGNDFLGRGDLAEAVRCYRQAVAAGPEESAPMLNLGYALSEQQQWPEARQWLQEVVRREPQQHEAHFLLGRIARGAGDPALAAQCHARAAAAQPMFELAHIERYQALLASGEQERALEVLQGSVAAHPGFADARAVLGQRHLQQGDAAAARSTFEQLVALRPEDPAAHAQLGLAWESDGQIDRAQASYLRALTLDAGHVQAHFGMGNVSMARSDAAGAALCYQQVLALMPGHLPALVNLAKALVACGRYQEAGDCFSQALRQEPANEAALLGISNCLLALERSAEALAAYDRLLLLHPQHAQGHLNRGNALQALRRDEEALRSFRQALQCRPGYVEALVNIGNVLQSQNRHAEAIKALQQALQQDPTSAAAHWNLALCRLVQGDLEAGWLHAEWRWPALQREPLRTPQPQWTGTEDLTGKTILLHAEQGLGDTIQFCRYVPMVVAHGAKVLLHVQAPLRSLVQSLGAPFTPHLEDVGTPSIDYHCPLLSLPLAFRTTAATIPNAVPYLRADPALVRTWRNRLTGDSRLTVGLVWSGNPAHVNDHNRSLSLDAVAGLASEGIRLVSLQKDLRDADHGTLALANITHFGAQLTDFQQTAALVQCLDLVISVDTSVAHLAGAMGKPVWIMLPFSPDWRWMLERPDTPWYPTARLFRQPAAGDWGRVLACIRDALRQWSERGGLAC